jgi:hypothetical protein
MSQRALDRAAKAVYLDNCLTRIPPTNLRNMWAIAQYLIVDRAVRTVSPTREPQEEIFHAEIQLLEYYERRGPMQWPRVLGDSKKARFLRDSFTKTHCLP